VPQGRLLVYFEGFCEGLTLTVLAKGCALVTSGSQR